MRRVFAVVLIGLGVFAVVLAILLPTVVVDHSKKTPLNLNITQISSGPATVLDATSGQERKVNLRATRHVVSDSHASDGTNTTVNESLCIVIVQGSTPNCLRSPDPRLLSITTDRVTTNRRSAEATHVAKYHENVNGNASVRHTGLAYKWPIDAKKKTYQFYSPDLLKAFPAVYKGTAKRKGLKVYEYVCSTGSQPYKIQGILDGTYTDTRTVWVEPRTGAIIDGLEHQVQTLATGQVALDTTLSFDDSAIKYQANYAKGKIDDLRQAQLWGPLILGIIALLCFVGAFLLLRFRRHTGGGRHGEAELGDGPPPSDTPPNHGSPPDTDEPPNYGTPPEFAGSSQT